MQEKHVFEYAVIRVVPRVEREEFLNVGVILYCRRQKFLQLRFQVDEKRLCAFSITLPVEELKEQLASFEQICVGSKEGGPIGQLEMADRFRWLTAARSTLVQASKVHPGLCSDAQETLTRLFSEQVI